MVIDNPQTITAENLPTSRMTYGHFLEYLKMGWVNKVDFYEDGHYIVIEASSPELGNRPQLVRVEIPVNASEQLVAKLRTTDIDIDAHGSSAPSVQNQNINFSRF